MKNIIISLFLILISSVLNAQIPCSPQFQKHLSAIQKVPQAQKLIDKILQEGPISIVADTSKLARSVGAFWDPLNRLIHIGHFADVSDGVIIGSILFELHNAAVDSQFQRLDRMAKQRRISKESYIQSMEYIEFLNSHQSAKIAEEGVSRGLFPINARLPTFRTFDEHFHIQKMSGHSNHFSRNYDLLMRSDTY